MSAEAVAPEQGGRSYHHGDLRSALVAAAVARVEEVGAEHLSLRAVAAEVGGSPSAAYHHFADKDALLGEVAATGLHMLVESVSTDVAAIPGETREAARLRFRAAGQAYVSFALSHPLGKAIESWPAVVVVSLVVGAVVWSATTRSPRAAL